MRRFKLKIQPKKPMDFAANAMPYEEMKLQLKDHRRKLIREVGEVNKLLRTIDHWWNTEEPHDPPFETEPYFDSYFTILIEDAD